MNNVFKFPGCPTSAGQKIIAFLALIVLCNATGALGYNSAEEALAWIDNVITNYPNTATVSGDCSIQFHSTGGLLPPAQPEPFEKVLTKADGYEFVRSGTGVQYSWVLRLPSWARNSLGVNGCPEKLFPNYYKANTPKPSEPQFGHKVVYGFLPN